MADRDQLVTRSMELQQEFARLVRRIDQDELPSAVEAARSIANNIETLLAEMQADFAADFKTHRLRTLPSDLESIRKFESNRPKREDLAELTAVAAHFSRHVKAMDTLIRLAYPPEPFSIRPYVEKYGRSVARVVAGVVVFFVLCSTYSAFKSKRVGLAARYYGDVNFSAAERFRNDGKIDFRWGRGSPFRRWRHDNFSVRWTGYLYVPYADRWQITVVSDDGSRVYLGGKMIITNWGIHGASGQTAELKLKEGYYPITVEYYEAGWDALVRLLWRGGSESRPTVIRSSYLKPSVRFLKKGIPVFETLEEGALVSSPSLEAEAKAAADAAAKEAAKKAAEEEAAKKAAGKSPAKAPKK